MGSDRGWEGTRGDLTFLFRPCFPFRTSSELHSPGLLRVVVSDRGLLEESVQLQLVVVGLREGMDEGIEAQDRMDGWMDVCDESVAGGGREEGLTILSAGRSLTFSLATSNCGWMERERMGGRG